jgi:hypothetical protein
MNKFSGELRQADDSDHGAAARLADALHGRRVGSGWHGVRDMMIAIPVCPSAMTEAFY